MINQNKEHMNIVIVGHVDHGKSTVIGRLLADTGSLPEGKLESVRERCRKNAKPFEYAFLLDALKDEQEQGITIDAARCFFKSDKRDYIIIDAPGHIEFLRNMVTGAARAEAALLVIDANEGIQENSKRHGYLLSMLGIKKIAVLVNKMDLVDYDKTVFENIVTEYSAFLETIGVTPLTFVPISAFHGDNIIGYSDHTPWYEGKDVLSLLDSLDSEGASDQEPFRMPVQGIYKFTKGGDDRRIVAGTVEYGSLSVGDHVTFYPSGKGSKVKSIESFATEKKTTIGAGYATGFTLEEQIYIKRGEIAVKTDDVIEPISATGFKANIFWLGKTPLTIGKSYNFKVGTMTVSGTVEEIIRTLDASSLDASVKAVVDRHEVAEILIKTNKPVAFDLSQGLAKTSRFVIVDDYEIAGGGIILSQMGVDTVANEHKIIKNSRWQNSLVNRQQRVDRLSQIPTLVLISGGKDSGKKPLAKALEKDLFERGRLAYFLSVGNIKYGVDDGRQDQAHILQLTEVANVLLDAGNITISTATDLTREDYGIIDNHIDGHKCIKVWIGDGGDINEADIIIKSEELALGTNIITDFLKDQGIIYKGA